MAHSLKHFTGTFSRVILSKSSFIGTPTKYWTSAPALFATSGHGINLNQTNKTCLLPDTPQPQPLLVLQLHTELLTMDITDGKSKRQRTISGGCNKKNTLHPPPRQGMKILDKFAFDKDISVPTIIVFEDQLSPKILQQVKPYLLKIQGIKAIQENDIETNSNDSSTTCQEKISPDESGGPRKTKKILLNPDLVKSKEFIKFVAEEIRFEPHAISSLCHVTVKFTYENWTWNQIFDAVLPDEQDKLSSFSNIGHILHLNLRDHLLPYKELIGKVFLDKISTAKTVVNKLNNIDNTYRNFQMEILSGDPNTVVHLRENRCEYEFDFKDVYWNSRLSAEHERVVKIAQSGDIFYDVFAGVGPFTVPAGKKRCIVLANDLNPASYKWLQHNVKKNKVHGVVTCFNQDGRDFITSTLSSDLKERLQKSENLDSPEAFDFANKKFHAVMNLPAIAVEFLDAFWGILEDLPSTLVPKNLTFLVHVYCFIKDTEGYKEKALALVEEKLKYKIPKSNVIEIGMVRNVAPNKEMLRVSFNLPHEIMLNKISAAASNNNPAISKRKHSEIDD